MRQKITTELVRKLPLTDVDIHDTTLRGFVLRCRASGHHTYRVTIGRGRVVTVGPVDRLMPVEARELARRILADVVRGHDPIAAKKQARAAMTFSTYLTDHYEPWKLEQHKRGKETIQRLRSVFEDFGALKLSDLTTWTVEKWRTERLKGAHGKKPKPATVNSHLTMLKAALAKAVAWKLLPTHPLDVKPIKTDKTGRVRYLTPDEDTRLRAALDARDAARRTRREQANVWRRERGYAEWPPDAPDHLTSIVIVALNTGLRKSEICQLRWSDVDLVRAQLTVRGTGAKSAQTRYLPLNTEALDVLRSWQQTTDQTDGTSHLFIGTKDGARLYDVKTAWRPVVKAAKLTDFTFHDLRHTFASRLVMASVDLNTVRELLGHADITMTLRYAHLAPGKLADAVATLMARA